ncbi:hemerythrin domain-containing protein [Pseudonocardia sp.]|uniref:hemerythrin domain-containing protein n=1 Tax=Pseudonocardia sp. TaxID=60912 RepID=UPI00262D92FB|nr:hemerythrin domain-containing protein [Pseudonocardia sp.]
MSATRPDVIRLILDDHESFRARFAELDTLRDDATAAAAVWGPLAAELEVHATAEEEFFYPQLLDRVDGMVDETEDAVSDHDEIRHGIRRAAAAEPGSDEWWAGISDARAANDEHLAEEERDDLAPFLEKTSLEVRERVGEQFAAFKREHAHGAGLDYSDTGSDEYLAEHT